MLFLLSLLNSWRRSFLRGSLSFVGWRAGSKCPVLSRGVEQCGWNLLSSLDGSCCPISWVCSCWLCEQQRGWPSRVDLINEQSWFPPLFPLWWESASQVKHGEYICSREGHCNTICWCRLAWLWSGGTWEMWTLAQAGLVSFRGYLGLTRASQLPFPSPLCLLLAEQIALREVAGGDDWQQGAEQADAGRESENLSGKGSSLEVEYVLMLG